MKLSTNIAAACLGSLLLGSAVSAANAQSISLSNDDRVALQSLRANGFTDGKVVSKSFFIIRAEACRGNDKFLVKVNPLGKITSSTKIGTCATAAPSPQRKFTVQQALNQLAGSKYTQVNATQQGRGVYVTACDGSRKVEFNFRPNGKTTQQNIIGRCSAQIGLTAQQIQDILRDKGYRRIAITDNELPQYVAEACLRAERVRITMNHRGRIRSERTIGDCARQFNPADLAALLEKNGYDRVKVIEQRRPPYLAEACQGKNRFEIEVGRFGRLRDKTRVGSCRTEINPQNLASILEKEGLNRIRTLRTNRAPYLAEGCTGNRLVEVSISRYGRILNQQRVGRCADPVTEASLKERLISEGNMNVLLARRNGNWRAEMCRDDVKLAVRYDDYGDILRERKVGTCASNTVLDVLKTLESRGAEKTTMQIVGCFKGTQYRWLFDRLGNRTGRERIGKCS